MKSLVKLTRKNVYIQKSKTFINAKTKDYMELVIGKNSLTYIKNLKQSSKHSKIF